MVALVVVVVIIAAAFYIEIPMVSKTSSTSTSLSVSTSSSQSSTSVGPSTGTLTINTQQPLIVAPDNSESVTLTLSAIGTVTGTYAFSATGLPQGVTAGFSPASVDLPSQLQTTVTMTLTAASGAQVVNSTTTLVATAGSSVYKSPFPIMSVQALVFIQGNSFHPSSLSVPTGTKVYWIDLDPSSSPDLGPDMHDVTAADHSFSSGAGALGQYAIYGHTFTAAGTVAYESTSPSTFNGQVVVTG
jgi:plastocyanin